MTYQGSILDLYPKPGQMVVWLKQSDGSCVRLVDMWKPRIHVGGALDDPLNLQPFVPTCRFTNKFEKAGDKQRIANAGRSINVTDENILNASYGGADLYLLFNLWYGHLNFNFTPSYINNAPQTDHIFPQSLLKDIKVKNPETGRNVMKYKEFDRDQIANCMLLTAAENRAGGKGDTPPEEWFKDNDATYLETHLIPNNPSLWKNENYDVFISERKKLLIDNFKKIINQ